MLDNKLCTVTAFEPEPASLAALQQQKGPLETYLPDAVGDGWHHTLRLTEETGMASFLEPDMDRLDLFQGFSGWGHVVDRVIMPTRRLDDIEEVRGHGHAEGPTRTVGELMVLRGAQEASR